jgi:hypothetical protein
MNCYVLLLSLDRSFGSAVALELQNGSSLNSLVGALLRYPGHNSSGNAAKSGIEDAARISLKRIGKSNAACGGRL